MGISFRDLKSRRTETLGQYVAGLNSEKRSYKDDRYWVPGVDKNGNGSAIIRFLPAPPDDGEDGFAWVKLYSHNFQGPSGKYYIENSLSTLGQSDFISEVNRALWNTKSERNQNIVRGMKRKLSFISNILVIRDPANPENEGKVFLFKYGQKIWDKISALLQPDPETGEAPVQIFDFWDGANFQLKMKNVKSGDKEYRNYDDSKFLSRSALYDGDDAKLEAVWKSEYSLLAEIAPDKFKSPEDLKRRFLEAMDGKMLALIEEVLPGFDATETVSGARKTATEAPAETKAEPKRTTRKSTKQPEKAEDDIPFDDIDPKDGESADSYFKTLAADDE